MTPTLPMEEHCEAYFAWKRAGIKDAWCWHVDAHLDIGTDGLGSERLSQLAPCQSHAEARSAGLCGNSYLPWGGLHCGNYLYPAIQEGIVGKLTWVIPPGIIEGRLLSWSREHLNGWFDLSLAECDGLQELKGRVEGTLLGIPFEMGTVENLELPGEPVLFDLDIDYFLTAEEEVWWPAEELAALVKPLKSLYTTVAYSVKGGYTPTELRTLAAPFIEGSTEGYSGTPLDRAAGMVRAQRHQDAVPVLKELRSTHPVEAGYLLGSCHHHLGQLEEALAAWTELFQLELPPDGRAYLLGLCSEVLCKLERPEEALKLAKEALKLMGDEDYRYHWACAAAYDKMNQPRRALQALRRTLKLAEPYLFGLRARSTLARIYRAQGKEGLAKIELAKLAASDSMGVFKPLTLLR